MTGRFLQGRVLQGRVLEGRVAIVTGAAHGIGAACARVYAQAGAQVVVADIDVAQGEATVAAISGAGGNARFIACDVGRSADCSALVAQAVAAFGRLDILHANAGIELCRSVWDTTDEEWDRILAINLSGSFWCARAAMRVMRDAGRGGVVTFTASPHAFLTSREIAAYAATKGGQVALMRALVAEPHAMLLDEPFNKLDAALRQTMRSFVFEHIAARRIPCLMVTHDQGDVPASGRLLLLKDAMVTDA